MFCLGLALLGLDHFPGEVLFVGRAVAGVAENMWMAADQLFAHAGGHIVEVEPENALRMTNAKFVRRFEVIEAELAKIGKTPDQSDLAEMDALWNAAKVAERENS